MKVSFTLGPGQDIRVNNIASRILTENLSRKFDVDFLNFSLMSSYQSYKDIGYYSEQISIKNKNLGICGSSWFNMLKVALGNYHHTHFLLNELKTDYLFYSCSLTMFEFNTVSIILNHGIKLIIGGPLLNNFSFNQIRNILSKTVKEKYMNNLLIVKGYVDLTTDLYKIVKEWKDFEIIENDFSTFWECENDYIVEKTNIFRKFEKHINTSFLDGFYPSNYSIFILDNKCWWGKCKFCMYTFFDPIDYTGGLSEDKISENIIKTTRLHGNDTIFFANDYFSFNEKYEKIMQNIVDNGLKIVIFTGIKSLQNKKYIDKINKYIHALKLGVESFSDFGLKYINKGYTYKDIQEASLNIKKYLKKDIFILSNIITDLPDRNERDIIQNYERAAEFKEEMIDSGFDVKYSPKMLIINNHTRDRFIDNSSIVDRYENGYVSGRYLLFEYFKDLNIITDDMYKEMALPLLRLDENRNKLRTDYDIISTELAERVMRW